MRWVHAQLVVEAVLFLVAVVGLVYLVSGCDPADQARVENAAAVAQYDLALVECKEKARAAKDFAVYEACERAVTRKLCEDSEPLRREWKACAEVGVSP